MGEVFQTENTRYLYSERYPNKIQKIKIKMFTAMALW